MADGNPFAKILPWVGVFVLGLGAASSSGVALWRIDAQAQDIEDHSESIDEVEDAVEVIQRQLIERQGQVELRTQRIEIEQNIQSQKLDEQSETLDEILLLLQRQSRGD